MDHGHRRALPNFALEVRNNAEFCLKIIFSDVLTKLIFTSDVTRISKIVGFGEVAILE